MFPSLLLQFTPPPSHLEPLRELRAQNSRIERILLSFSSSSHPPPLLQHVAFQGYQQEKGAGKGWGMPFSSLPLEWAKIKELLCDARRKEMISAQVTPWMLNPNVFQLRSVALKKENERGKNPLIFFAALGSESIWCQAERRQRVSN